VRLTHPVGDAAGGGYTYLRTLKVPEGFPSLAVAAAAAIDGSRIELGPGEHRLALSIARLRLEIVGTAGARAATLEKDALSVGLRLSAGADVTLRGVTVTAVQGAPPGSGILVGSGCRLRLLAAAMTGNFSRGAGAAITVAGGGRLEVSRSRLIGNDSLEAGGAIAVEPGGSARISSSILASNHTGGRGGAIAVFATEPGAVRIDGCTFAWNEAVLEGGAIFEATAGAAGITGSLFWGNQAGDGSGDLSPGSWRAVRGCLLSAPGISGISRNLDARAVDLPFELPGLLPLPGSAALDAGPPGTDLPESFADLDGLPRPLDGDGDGRALLDLGAFEIGPRPSVELRIEAGAGRDSRRIGFTAAIEGAWDSIRWDFGDGSPPVEEGPSTSHHYQAPGSYRVLVETRLLDHSTGASVLVKVLDTYLRGDCSGDGTIDLTDTVVLLDHLFLAGPTPGCPAACDANASGCLTVSDTIAILRHLFLGGSLSPPATCDDLPAPTELPCVENACGRGN